MKKDFLIITGGTIDYGFAKNYIEAHSFEQVITADRGMEFCKEAKILPDLILGDFDSANSSAFEYFQRCCPERMERFPSEKDETDTELAILRAMERGADSVTIIGGTGTRLDHVLGNIQLLKMAWEMGIKCYLVDPHNRIQLIGVRPQGRGSDPRIGGQTPILTLQKSRQFGKYVSLIPFSQNVEGLTLNGFAYDVENFTLESGKARGVSNEILQEEGQISFDSGVLLVIESRD